MVNWKHNAEIKFAEVKNEDVKKPKVLLELASDAGCAIALINDTLHVVGSDTAKFDAFIATIKSTKVKEPPKDETPPGETEANKDKESEANKDKEEKPKT